MSLVALEFSSKPRVIEKRTAVRVGKRRPLKEEPMKKQDVLKGDYIDGVGR